MLPSRWIAGAGYLRVVLIVGLTTVSGCAGPHVAKFERKRAGRVYCVRGFLDVFSLGMNRLAEELRKEGVDARAMSGPAWRVAARQIESDFTLRADPGPLIFVGHSYGADHAVDMARSLQRHGIRVRLLVLLDATTPSRVPANVEQCLHLYKPTLAGDILPFIFAGNPVVLDSDNHNTQLVNDVISTEELGPRAATVNHFNIDKSDVIHSYLIREIIEVCPALDSSPEFAGGNDRSSSTTTLEATYATP